MEENKLSCFVGSYSLTILDAMEKIDANSKGILFITDENQRLLGSITDGDIRRWLMNSGELSALVAMAMNKEPISLCTGETHKAEQLMKDKSITAIPILSNVGKITDVVLLDDDFRNKKGDLSGVDVVVMAGGMGTRLYPYTKILPKPLIPIGDIPIVERIINYYTEYGVKSFYMTVNYKKEMIRSYFDESGKNYTIKYVEEDKPLGTCGSVKLIKDTFDAPLFVTNCDAIILADYYDIYQYHLRSNNAITMVSALKNFQVPYGVIHTGDNGILESMEEKPKLSYFINTGMYIINPETIQLIPEGTMFHMTHLIEKVMQNGGKVGTYPVSEDAFLDMGEFDEMKRMEEKLHIG